MQYLISSKDEYKILKRKDSDATEHGVCVFYSCFLYCIKLGFFAENEDQRLFALTVEKDCHLGDENV